LHAAVLPVEGIFTDRTNGAQRRAKLVETQSRYLLFV